MASALFPRRDPPEPLILHGVAGQPANRPGVAVDASSSSSSRVETTVARSSPIAYVSVPRGFRSASPSRRGRSERPFLWRLRHCRDDLGSAAGESALSPRAWSGAKRRWLKSPNWCWETISVTLSGVGGVGKTRLAIAVASEIASEFPDGNWIVDLA